MIQQLLNLRPPSITQSPMIPDHLPLLSYQQIKPYHRFPVPLLSLDNPRCIDGYLLALKQRHIIGGISVPVTGRHTILRPLWHELFRQITETGFNKPLFIQGKFFPDGEEPEQFEKLLFQTLQPPITGVTFTFQLQKGELLLEQLKPICDTLQQQGIALFLNIQHHIPGDTTQFEQFFNKMRSLNITPDAVQIPPHPALDRYLTSKLRVTLMRDIMAQQPATGHPIYTLAPRMICSGEPFYTFQTLFRRHNINHTLGDFVAAMTQ